MYKCILIVIDGFELVDKGLVKGLELVKDFNVEVDIVIVFELWVVGMYDVMGWSVGYMNSLEYKVDCEEGV